MTRGCSKCGSAFSCAWYTSKETRNTADLLWRASYSANADLLNVFPPRNHAEHSKHADYLDENNRCDTVSRDDQLVCHTSSRSGSNRSNTFSFLGSSCRLMNSSCAVLGLFVVLCPSSIDYTSSLDICVRYIVGCCCYDFLARCEHTFLCLPVIR